jgi:hypothetical protein
MRVEQQRDGAEQKNGKMTAVMATTVALSHERPFRSMSIVAEAYRRAGVLFNTAGTNGIS